MVWVSAGAIFLTGCVTISTGLDVPKGLSYNLKQTYAVELFRVKELFRGKPLYKIRSFSEIRGSIGARASKREQLALLHRMRLLTQGAYRDWSWRIWATPQVVASWARWRSSAAVHACLHRRCTPLRWKSAFVRLYRVMDYLLGKPPLPLSLRINLIPAGLPFKTSVTRRWRRAVPLVFTFPYPVTPSMDAHSQETRIRAFVYAISLVSYEFQHVEYTAHDTKGPQSSSPGVRTLKNEATSMCWQLAAKLALLAGRPQTLTIQLPDISTFSAVFGPVVRYKTDAAWGPALIKRDLAEYLERVAPASVGAWNVRIALTDYPVMNRVFAYCRGFSRFPGDIARGHMPARKVAHAQFWSTAQGFYK